MSTGSNKLDRNYVVALLTTFFPAVQRKTDIPGWREEWHGCVYLTTPVGQISWHYHDDHAFLFAHVAQAPEGFEWDGHDTDEKHKRILDLIESFSTWDAHPQGRFAMGAFCERLFTDGFIEPSRRAEFLACAENARQGNGFTLPDDFGTDTKNEDQDLEEWLS